jgi:hypothetical protein
MSAFFGTINPGGSSRDVALIRKILERTKQGKVRWQRILNAISAATPNGLQFDFVLSTPFGSLGSSWVMFTVRDQGAEIMRVQRNIAALNLPSLIVTTDPVNDAAEELFQAVSGSAEDNVDRASRKLDNI